MATTVKREVLRARAVLAGNGITGEAELAEVERGTQQLVRLILRVRGDPSVLTPGRLGHRPRVRDR